MNKQRLIPLIVATALFMENMDSTVIATSLPAIAADIGTSPLTLKLAITSYLLSLAVFIPAFFMQGAARSLFLPLTLAVGFSMVASYFLSSTLVPVLSVWILRKNDGKEKHSTFEKFQSPVKAEQIDGLPH